MSIFIALCAESLFARTVRPDRYLTDTEPRKDYAKPVSVGRFRSRMANNFANMFKNNQLGTEADATSVLKSKEDSRSTRQRSNSLQQQDRRMVAGVSRSFRGGAYRSVTNKDRRQALKRDNQSLKRSMRYENELGNLNYAPQKTVLANTSENESEIKPSISRMSSFRKEFNRSMKASKPSVGSPGMQKSRSNESRSENQSVASHFSQPSPVKQSADSSSDRSNGELHIMSLEELIAKMKNDNNHRKLNEAGDILSEKGSDYQKIEDEAQHQEENDAKQVIVQDNAADLIKQENALQQSDNQIESNSNTDNLDQMKEADEKKENIKKDREAVSSPLQAADLAISQVSMADVSLNNPQSQLGDTNLQNNTTPLGGISANNQSTLSDGLARYKYLLAFQKDLEKRGQDLTLKGLNAKNMEDHLKALGEQLTASHMQLVQDEIILNNKYEALSGLQNNVNQLITQNQIRAEKIRDEENTLKAANDRYQADLDAFKGEVAAFNEQKSSLDQSKIRIEEEISVVRDEASIEKRSELNLDMQMKELEDKIRQQYTLEEGIVKRKNFLKNEMSKLSNLKEHMEKHEQVLQKKANELFQHNSSLTQKENNLAKKEVILNLREDVVYKRETYCQCSAEHVRKDDNMDELISKYKSTIDECLNSEIQTSLSLQTPDNINVDFNALNSAAVPDQRNLTGLPSTTPALDRVPIVLTDDYFKQKKFFTSD